MNLVAVRRAHGVGHGRHGALNRVLERGFPLAWWQRLSSGEDAVVSTLDQTLQVFRALLSDDQPVDLSEADAAIWSYLSSVDGLRGQAEALDRLCQEVSHLESSSPFLPRLKDSLRRHQERLSEQSV